MNSETSTVKKADAGAAQPRFAVLIDADNAAAAIVEGLFAEIAKYGVASVKRIYGDWTQPNLQSWKKTLLDQSIQPVQQFAYTRGKNATDSALIIDAMDLMYTERFQGFCLVSSDSDFTRLAVRLRQEGLVVLGFGEKKTPSPFIAACDKFIYTELLRAAPKAEPAGVRQGAAQRPPATTPPADRVEPEEQDIEDISAEVARIIAQAVDATSDDSGWASLGGVGTMATKIKSDFDCRLYGHKKLSDLVRAFPEYFELTERASSATGGKAVYVRNRAS
jgi:NYN domain/OST-HTH/LOTUS domain